MDGRKGGWIDSIFGARMSGQMVEAAKGCLDGLSNSFVDGSLDGMVDGLNRRLRLDRVRSVYGPAIKAYPIRAPQLLSIGAGRSASQEASDSPAQWLLRQLHN